jgi:hydrogenase expression/formation protein HypE
MTIKKDYIRPLDFKHGRVDMNHGAGGRASMQLIEELFAKAFDGEGKTLGNDGAVLTMPAPWFMSMRPCLKSRGRM